MTQQLKRLDQLYDFNSRTPIFPTLRNLVKAIELRLQTVEATKASYEATINQITALALQRMNEVFTPLIVDAQQRLEQFGANFAAHSSTSLTIGSGPMVLSVDEADRAGFVYADYAAVRVHGSTGDYMLCRIDGYDREIGTLFFTSIVYSGEGEYDDWDITISAAPDLTHSARTDNPHSVTAAQVGAYTSGQVDSIITAWTNSLLASINPSSFLTKAGNLSGLNSYEEVWLNLGLKTAAGKDIGTSGNKVPTLDAGNQWSKTQGVVPRAITSGAPIDLATGQLWTAAVNGMDFLVSNPGTPPPWTLTPFSIFVTFVTSHQISFGNKFKLTGYAPSATAGARDMLVFLYDQSGDEYDLIGYRRGVNQ